MESVRPRSDRMTGTPVATVSGTEVGKVFPGPMTANWRWRETDAGDVQSLFQKGSIMKLYILPETLKRIDAALRAVIDQYADDDYAEGDSHAVRLCRDALAAIEADPSKHVGLEDYVEDDHCLTICIGCGAKWERTDEVDEHGQDYEAYTLIEAGIEAGDGSCA
jgi:hypothetical protein